MLRARCEVSCPRGGRRAGDTESGLWTLEALCHIHQAQEQLAPGHVDLSSPTDSYQPRSLLEILLL